VIDTTTFIKGGKVNEFQHQLEKYLNVKHVIPVANGTMHFRCSDGFGVETG
jgi:dTDP-4-amino-4,6-dideoxygalactose transaminase